VIYLRWEACNSQPVTNCEMGRAKAWPIFYCGECLLSAKSGRSLMLK